MIEIKNKAECAGCHACYNICPRSCIKMLPDGEGFLYPEVEADKCIGCGLCLQVCPMKGAAEYQNAYNTEYYACINKDEDVRRESSSGGIFSLLATNVIKEGGVVFGARFDSNFDLRHFSAATAEELKELRGSKYVQSIVGATFSDAKNCLENGVSVLFSGTPCQIAGLKLFLGKDYPNLLTVDLICHGVPSPKVFKKHIEKISRGKISNIKKISFRDKRLGWKKFSFTMLFKNGDAHSKAFSKDSFMKLFLGNLCLRPACHECLFNRPLKKYSDITLGDYWGVSSIFPELDDGRGVSLVLINSEKGALYFDELKSKMIIKKSSYDDAVCGNKCLTESASPNPNREEFFKMLDSHDIDHLAAKFVKSKPLAPIKKGLYGLYAKYIKK